MHVSRLIGGGLGVVVAIALGAAASVSPLVSSEHSAPRPIAIVAQLAPASGARLADTRTHARLIAWSD